jgi:hypothetical protein
VREVKNQCPNCGRVTYVAADSWSGTTQANLDAPCAGGCELQPARIYADLRQSQREPDRGGLMPALFAAAVVVVPIAGVVLAQTR